MIRTEQTEICLKFTEKFKLENAQKIDSSYTTKNRESIKSNRHIREQQK
jgi:hypothetical protein